MNPNLRPFVAWAALAAVFAFSYASSFAKPKNELLGLNAPTLFLLTWAKFDAVKPPELVDRVYAVPSEADIKRLLKFHTKRKEFASYIPEQWDCDDFAREFQYLAHVWSRHHYGTTRVSLTVGRAYVQFNGNVSDLFPGDNSWRTDLHVTNVILRDDGRWFWYEPQSGALSPVESALYEGSITVYHIEM